MMTTLPLLDEMPELRGRVSRWSVEDYERLVTSGLAPKRGELIRGIIVDKMSKSDLHVDLCTWLCEELRRLLPADYRVYQDGPLRLRDSEPEPDVSIVKGTRAELRGKGHPPTALLVIEVAVSSVMEDRQYAALYAEAGVPEYWIVLAEEQRVEVRRDPVRGAYQRVQTYQRGETLVCEGLPEAAVNLDELFG